MLEPSPSEDLDLHLTATGPPLDYTLDCEEPDIYHQMHVGPVRGRVEPEVRRWLEGLTDRDFGRVDFLVGMLAEPPELLGEPHSRHLGGTVRELRFRLLRQQTRVTYWLAPNRCIVLLTVFHKTRSVEVAEVERALQVQKTCEAVHGVDHDVYEREGHRDE